LKKAKTIAKGLLRVLRQSVLAAMVLLLLFLLLNALFPFRPNLEWSREVRDRNGELLYAGLTSDEKWRLYAPDSAISPELAAAIVHKEDRWFYVHPGVNPAAVGRALANNAAQGRRTSGASTITMQVVRLLEPAPRTYGQKLLEMFRACQLTLLYSKREILQLYLNRLPYGGNIEGIRTASLFYLDKEPAQLSPAEVAALAVVPNRPGSLRPGRHNAELIEARNHWLQRFGREGIFSPDEVASALREPFEPERRPAPSRAPHLVRRLLRDNPDSRELYASLDAGLQERVERLLQDYVRGLQPYGIHNACALLLDNATSQVLAYVGSADFQDTRDGGQVDGLQALRSPGSALKPLLYALAMDSGLLTPKTVLLDVATDFQGYRPANFDRTFSGPVSAEHALGQSLNLPAVRLLERYGVENFRRKLGDMGCRSMQAQKGQLGLSMVLGGCGIRPEELALLYAGIANRGWCRPLQYTLSGPVSARAKGVRTPGDSLRLVSEGAAWAIGDMLTQLQRPDLPEGMDRTEGLPLIAWKTGTSYGRRDAWSVGFNTRYTLVVWSGNFSGQGVPELTGAGVAAPLLFDLFLSLDRESGKTWFAMPESLRFRYVCSRSGLPPAPGCTDQVMDYFLPLVSAAGPCAHQREVRLSADRKISYCMECLPASGYVLDTLDHPEPELLAWYRQQGLPTPPLPPHNPACQSVLAGQAPRIVSPVEALTYLRYEGAGQVELACLAADEVREVFWYIDDRFYARSAPQTPQFFTPTPGKHKISCADDKGRSSHVWIQAEAL
jgi:penicillin-binding protein 1C